jgi:hypothetical protein
VSASVCDDYSNLFTFLIEDIISHSPVLMTPQEAEAIEGIGEPFSAYTLCEHSKQILGHQRAPDLVSVFARCTVTCIGGCADLTLKSLRTLAEFHLVMAVLQSILSGSPPGPDRCLIGSQFHSEQDIRIGRTMNRNTHCACPLRRG